MLVLNIFSLASLTDVQARANQAVIKDLITLRLAV